MRLPGFFLIAEGFGSKLHIMLKLVSICALAACALHAESPFPAVDRLPVNVDLPSPLILMSGKSVASAAEWRDQRRPELKNLFQHYMYGTLPPAPEKVTATIERMDPHYFGGKATKKELLLSFGPEGTPPIHLLLVIPNLPKQPSPVVLGLNFCGNYSVVNDPSMPVPTNWMTASCKGCVNGKASEAGRGTDAQSWVIEQSIDRGYAIATFYNGDVFPDKPDYSGGIFPFYHKAGQEKREAHEWGAIAAWAWGLQRAVDYLVTDPAIDAGRIAVFGHSRNGKTALVAGAFDERISLVLSHQAGCGGTAPSRGKIGESVKRINTSFPHWFCETFHEFNDQPEKLPFDQHSLIALCAPRPVLLSNATEDTWANPEGQFEMLKAADPVYRLLQAKGLGADQRPADGVLLDSPLGYFIRPGKHSTTAQDWKAFLDFADRMLLN
jgi:hypothetical protein